MVLSLSRLATISALVLGSCFWLSPVPATAGTTMISSCDNPGEIRGTAELAADLDCSATGGGIAFRPYGVLKLNGHTATGFGVVCRAPFGGNNISASCKLVGPGSIVDGIFRVNGTARVENATIAGGYVYGHKIKIQNSTVIGWVDANHVVEAYGFPGARAAIIDSQIIGGRHGVDSEARVLLKRSTVRDSTDTAGTGGVTSPKVKIVESSVTGHGAAGVQGRAVAIRDSTIADNAWYGVTAAWDGLGKARLSIKRSTLSNNGFGAMAFGEECASHCDPLDIRVVDSIVLGNHLGGLQSERGTVRLSGDSAATGNGTDSECGVTVPCADVMSREAPRLSSGATCETSYDNGTGFPGAGWGVCSLD